MTQVLGIGVWILAGWAAFALGAQWLHARAFGRRVFFTTPAAPSRRGVVYAFGPGMLPSAKESARTHLAAWLVGVCFHAGVGAALLVLLLIAGAGGSAAVPRALAALCLPGAFAGIVLFARRLLDPALRGLSLLDDYVAIVLSTAFVALAGARAWTSTLTPWFLGAALLFLLYLPVGKIRHCLFFFFSRYHSAFHFARRGVLPPRP